MSRTATMAVGFFLVLMGIQLHVIESFTMTPRVSHFLNDNFSQEQASLVPPIVTSAPGNFPQSQQPYNSPYYRASYTQPNASAPTATHAIGSRRSSAQSKVAPPRWFCWPVLFLGAFLLLQGATKPRG